MRTPLIAGNWKMFKTTAEAKSYAEEFKKLYKGSDTKVCICAPYTQLLSLVEAFQDTGIAVGAQNVHFENEGAFTGEISADMLKEIGVNYCIVGHSERRQYFNETDETVGKKLKILFDNGITPILCVGETLEKRQNNQQETVVREQLKKDLNLLDGEQVGGLVIAYEPIWAIGTGLTASKEQANDMCGVIRNEIEKLYGLDAAQSIIIQYGGSVKPENVKDLMAMEQIDGTLVGGASLEPNKFIKIVNF